MQRKQYNCFFNNCEVVSNYVGHLGGGGGKVHAPCTPPLDPPSWLNKVGPLQNRSAW